jgi:integrase
MEPIHNRMPVILHPRDYDESRPPIDLLRPYEADGMRMTPANTWHCLRHATASRLVMAGVDRQTVAEILGHRTFQMVMRYIHLAPEHQIDAVERLINSRNRMATKSVNTFGAKRRVRKVGVSRIK